MLTNFSIRRVYRNFLEIAVLLALFSGCNRQAQIQDKNRVLPFAATPAVEDSYPAVQIDNQYNQQNADPKIELDPNDTIITLVNANLDFERNDEQIIAVQTRNKLNSRIRIIIAGFDKATNGYREAVQIETHSTNARAFHLTLVDLIGDHLKEIYCRGTNGAGEQTLDVYRKSVSPTGFGLSFSSICALNTDGTMEILEVERSAEYLAGKANGESYPIITLTQDTNSKNLMDLVQTTYRWDFTAGTYVFDRIEKIPGKKIQKEQLSELYRKGSRAFEDHLSGSWYLHDEKTKGKSEGIVAVNFDVSGRRFSIYTGEVQEVYTWFSTFKRLPTRVELNGGNELVPFMRKQLTVEVREIDAIQIVGNDSWAGTYKRIDPAMLNSLTKGSLQTDAISDQIPVLSGRYASDTGEEILFNEPSFTLAENGSKLSGGYSVYLANVVILELKVIDEAGLVVDDRRYRIEYSEEQRDDKIFRTIFLYPGIIGIYGFEPVSEEHIRFEQIESLDTEEEVVLRAIGYS